MSELLPFAPQVGISTFAYMAISLVIGVAFGFFLERAGFGSSTNLTAIFILRDFRVFRVMFTAVLTGMIGSQILHHLGIMNLALVSFEANYFWSILSGGLLFGVGFYVGGFCPGTAVVALARGRWDGLAFLFGIVLGIYGFALLFDGISDQGWFMSFFAPAGAAKETLYGDGPVWPWVLGIAAVALMGFRFAPVIERRFRLKTVAELRDTVSAADRGTTSGAATTPSVSTAPAPATAPGSTGGTATGSTTWKWLGPALAFTGALIILVAEWVRPIPIVFEEPAHRVAELPGQAVETEVSAQTLASWLIENAHRAHEGLAPNVLVADLRPARDRERLPVPGAIPLATDDLEQVVPLADVLAGVREGLAGIGQKPVVLLTEDSSATEELIAGLRRHDVWAFTLSGGMEAWRQQLRDPEDCFGPVLMAATSQPAPATRAIAWLAGQSQELPPRLVCLGAIPPETQVAAAVATTANRGGGCN